MMYIEEIAYRAIFRNIKPIISLFHQGVFRLGFVVLSHGFVQAEPWL